MIVSLDNVVQLLGKWKEEASGLTGIFQGDSVEVKFFGVVTEVSSSEFKIWWETWSLKIPLSGASFVYTEPREASEPDKELLAENFVCALRINLPLGNACTIFEYVREEDA